MKRAADAVRQRDHVRVGIDDQHGSDIDRAGARAAGARAASRCSSNWSAVTASTWTTTPRSAPSIAASQTAAISSISSGRAPLIIVRAPVERERMHLDAPGSLAAASRTTNSRLSTLCWVSVKMKPNGPPRRARVEVRDRSGECPFAAPDQVVLLGRAVDRDREHVDELGERVPAPRGEEHAVRGDRRQHAELAGAGEKLRQRAVEQRFAAGDRELPVSEARQRPRGSPRGAPTGAPLGPSVLTPSSSVRRRCCSAATDAPGERVPRRWGCRYP